VEASSALRFLDLVLERVIVAEMSNDPVGNELPLVAFIKSSRRLSGFRLEESLPDAFFSACHFAWLASF